jgi:L-threonylcarbamoyladenylate synthase
MKIEKINPSNTDKKLIFDAANVLKKGGILMYPTDTCYGLGADISNKIAFNKIYKIKKRSRTKPVSVITPDLKSIYNLAVIKPEQEKYIAKYLPGAVTLIFVTLDHDLFPFSSIGIRLPDYNVTQLISQAFKYPYVTTSANIGNYAPAYEVQDFLNQLEVGDIKPDLVLDAGRLPKNEPSTVVDLTSGKPKILRQGGVKVKEL